MLVDLPGLAFFTTYALLVLFWAEIYYQVRFYFDMFWYCSVTVSALMFHADVMFARHVQCRLMVSDQHSIRSME